MRQSFGLWILSLTVVLHADECKWWDYVEDGKVSGAGSSQKQCEENRKVREQFLHQALDAAQKYAQEAFRYQLQNTGADIKEIQRRSENRGKADRAEADARRAWTSLPQCTCQVRGESESEKNSRELREKQDHEAAISKAGQDATRPKTDEASGEVGSSQDQRYHNEVQKTISDLDAQFAEIDRQAKRDLDAELAEIDRQAALRFLEAQKRNAFKAEIDAAQDEVTRRRLIRERDAILTRIAQERAASQALLAEMKSNSPFSGGKLESTSDPSRRNPDDPATWTVPFASPKDEKTNQLVSTPSKELAASTAAKTFEKAAKIATQTLTKDAALAAARLPKAKAAEYIRATNEVTSFYKGFEGLFKYYDAAVGVGKIVQAEPGDDRSRATSELGITIAQNAAKSGATQAVETLGIRLSQIAAKSGTTLAVEMLPKRAAAVLLGPVAWGGSVVLSSERTDIGPSDVLTRPKDFSSEDKKEVLYHQMQAFAKQGQTWNAAQRDELVHLILVVHGTTGDK